MLSQAIRNPRRQMFVAIAITSLSFASIMWGVLEMRANDWEETTSSGLKIGLAILPAILAPFLILNFWWAARIESALRSGKDVIARWTISPDTLTEFVAEDVKRNSHGPAYQNDWTPTAVPSADAIEVIFGRTGVLVQDAYFPLVKSGPYKFTALGILPAFPMCIEFVTVATHFSNVSAISIRRFVAVLRLPVNSADDPEAQKVLDHYRGVLGGTTNANPGFYQRRIRFGLIGAAIFVPVALVGFVIGPQRPDYLDLPSLMVTFGSIFSFASLLLAALAWIINKRQQQPT
jgi:hypothetical protein